MKARSSKCLVQVFLVLTHTWPSGRARLSAFAWYTRFAKSARWPIVSFRAGPSRRACYPDTTLQAGQARLTLPARQTCTQDMLSVRMTTGVSYNQQHMNMHISIGCRLFSSFLHILCIAGISATVMLFFSKQVSQLTLINIIH